MASYWLFIVVAIMENGNAKVWKHHEVRNIMKYYIYISGSIVEAPCIYDYSNVPIKCNNDSFKFLK